MMEYDARVDLNKTTKKIRMIGRKVTIKLTIDLLFKSDTKKHDINNYESNQMNKKSHLI